MCNVCRNPRLILKDNDWPCTFCTYINTIKDDSCAICQNNRTLPEQLPQFPVQNNLIKNTDNKSIKSDIIPEDKQNDNVRIDEKNFAKINSPTNELSIKPISGIEIGQEIFEQNGVNMELFNDQTNMNNENIPDPKQDDLLFDLFPNEKEKEIKGSRNVYTIEELLSFRHAKGSKILISNIPCVKENSCNKNFNKPFFIRKEQIIYSNYIMSGFDLMNNSKHDKIISTENEISLMDDLMSGKNGSKSEYKNKSQILNINPNAVCKEEEKHLESSNDNKYSIDKSLSPLNNFGYGHLNKPKSILSTILPK